MARYDHFEEWDHVLYASTHGGFIPVEQITSVSSMKSLYDDTDSKLKG
jgi:hypothetical protein